MTKATFFAESLNTVSSLITGTNPEVIKDIKIINAYNITLVVSDKKYIAKIKMSLNNGQAILRDELNIKNDFSYSINENTIHAWGNLGTFLLIARHHGILSAEITSSLLISLKDGSFDTNISTTSPAQAEALRHTLKLYETNYQKAEETFQASSASGYTTAIFQP